MRMRRTWIEELTLRKRIKQLKEGQCEVCHSSDTVKQVSDISYRCDNCDTESVLIYE